jgi:hypothetical protein
MSYVVTAKMAHVKVPAKYTISNRPVMEDHVLTKGQTVPDEVDPVQLAHLVAAGMVAEELPPGVEPPAV